MNSVQWARRPAEAHFGPAAWQSKVLSAASAIFVKPVIAVLTLIGMVVNRVRPDLLQRARLDVIDRP